MNKRAEDPRRLKKLEKQLLPERRTTVEKPLQRTRAVAMADTAMT